ncbi:hypothetical protein RBB79_04675 [Tunturiibacter empetritectus]|uniref:Uncharacterized protein n=1 Tax=Tunturiibacter lichenicola TaxID=2051959 RepID=A0A852V7C1_9BACT|nr:hypothetical protein [Edaphobacter lichenicola]NYF88813.1 hypothetical protein [Edaphobacter lichenicola]
MRLLLLLSLLFSTLPIVAQNSGDAPQLIEGPQSASPPKAAAMNNDSVIRMAKAGLGEDLIIQTINTQPGRYNTDADSLVTLKTAGLSDRVLTAMMNKSRRQLTNVPETEKPIVLSDVNEIGVYYKDRSGRWTAIDPEIVHIKSGGFIKSTVTNGIIKQDRNGRVNGRESALALKRPIEVLLYTPEGVAATEYTFVRFRLNSSNREFRILTGGVFHSSGGADRDEVPFKPVRTAPRTYEFTVGDGVAGGEFGILPPGTGNVTNGGKIYTFAIVE